MFLSLQFFMVFPSRFSWPKSLTCFGFGDLWVGIQACAESRHEIFLVKNAISCFRPLVVRLVPEACTSLSTFDFFNRSTPPTEKSVQTRRSVLGVGRVVSMQWHWISFRRICLGMSGFKDGGCCANRFEAEVLTQVTLD